MAQIALPLDWPASETESAFVVGSSNAQAVRHLESHARWPIATTILTGPRKSGRSLLGRIFAARTGGVLIDDGEAADEEEVFLAWNRAQETRRPLLIVAAAAPPEWRPALPDLASRLSATPVVTIGDPDDEIRARLLPRLLERRGLSVTPELIHYLLPRLPRTYHGMLQAVETLDAASLATRRVLTVPFAREALNLGQSTLR